MIDTSKLKYFNTLCEKGLLSEDQNDLDSIMNTLEEKQFEYLKRLETTKDEGRKDEINELLNTIDLQLKEVASLKAAISSGIIIESANGAKTETKDEDKEQATKTTDNNGIDDKTKQKKGKTGAVIAVIALIAIVAVAAVFMLNRNGTGQETASNGASSAASDTKTENDENTAKIGLHTFTAEECRQAWAEMGETDDWDYLLDGLYIYDITNQALIDEGLQIGDRIITLNGENIKTSEDLTNTVAKYNPGDSAVLVIARGFEQLTFETVFITSAETLPARTSGEEIVQIDGRPYRFAYSEDGLSINAWQFGDE